MSYTTSFVVSFVLFSLVLAVTSNEIEKDLFTKFIQQYAKVYTEREFESRFSNFRESLQRIAERNRKSNGAVFGITKFSDMTPEEFQGTILMKNPIHPRNPTPQEILPTKVAAVPNFLDWRQKGAVTPVKNQEQCGSCWAFSTVENVESMWILAGKGTNATVDLSPQQVVDCDDTDMGCEGGDPPTAFDYIINAGGLDSESSYPYIGEDESCQFKPNDVVAKISSWQYATSWYSEETLQQNLVGWGPLSICVDAESWQDYASGVMTWEECAWVNVLDHCVQLVGYNSSSSTPYWIVRNSWGTDWGIDGYIWLQMWEDTCGISHEATCAVI